MIGFAFFHGWGFDSNFWTEIISESKDKEIPTLFFDAGYFGEPSLFPEFSNAVHWVAVCHSLGLLKALELNPPWYGLVAINSFTRFCRSDSNSSKSNSGWNPKVIRRMIRGIERDPRRIVNEFRLNCGGQVLSDEENINGEALIADLKRLIHSDERSKWVDIQERLPTLSLASSHDPIVDAELTRDCFHSGPIEWRESSSHLLPQADAIWCTNHILDFLGSCSK